MLRPAEAAFRRLLVTLAAMMEDGPIVRRASVRVFPAGIARGNGDSVPSFALFDQRKPLNPFGIFRGKRGNPRIWSPGMEYPVFEVVTEPSPDDPLNAMPLCRRLQALRNALDDLPKQARRLKRWEAKRALARGESGKFIRPMRPGRPPGHRSRQTHAVDAVLSHCHEMALYAMEVARSADWEAGSPFTGSVTRPP